MSVVTLKELTWDSECFAVPALQVKLTWNFAGQAGLECGAGATPAITSAPARPGVGRVAPSRGAAQRDSATRATRAFSGREARRPGL
jgi:hypothetical protein